MNKRQSIEDFEGNKQIDIDFDSLPAPAPPETIDPFLRSTLDQVLSTLSKQEISVLQMRFYDDQTLQATGQSLNLSRERIRQIEAKALRKLRHPTRSNRLLAFFDDIEVNKSEWMQTSWTDRKWKYHHLRLLAC